MKVVKLSQICQFTRGLTYKKSDEVEFSKNIVLRANNIDLNTNSLMLDDLRYIKDSIKINSEKLVKKNSLIICTASGSKSHLGKVALITKDYGYSFGGFMGQITPSKECHHRFLFYILTSPNFKDFLMSMTDGTNINNLKFIDIEDYEVSLPKYEDQVKIVEKLDNAFAEINSLEKNFKLKEEKTNQLLQSMLSAAFTNTDQFDIKIAKLSQICKFSRGLTYKKSDEVEFSKNIVLRANNIDLNTNSLILEDLRYIKDSIKIDPEKLVKKNSLIICTASGSKTHLGKVALITEEFGYSFGGFMGQITPSKDCHHRFLFYIFTSPSFKDFLMGLTDGTNINNLKFKDIENYELQLPKFEDQVKIVMKLDNTFAEIDKLKNQISIEKQRISSLRQSILSDAFNFEVEAA